MVEVDNSGFLSFYEFLKVTSTFCLFGQEEVLKFCFFIFDKDKNGYIEEDEMNALIDLLQTGMAQTEIGKQEGGGLNVLDALKKFDMNDDGRVDFDGRRVNIKIDGETLKPHRHVST